MYAMQDSVSSENHLLRMMRPSTSTNTNTVTDDYRNSLVVFGQARQAQATGFDRVIQPYLN